MNTLAAEQQLQDRKKLNQQKPYGNTPKDYCCTEQGVRTNPKEGDSVTVTYEPVWVTALSRDTEGGSWGRLILWRDHDKKKNEQAIPAALFHNRGTELAQRLAEGGLPIAPGRENLLLQYLAAFQPDDRLTAATTTGWLGEAFVLPDKTLNQPESEQIVYQPNGLNSTARAIKTAGSLEGWQQGMKEAHHQVIFVVCAALSAPLRYLTGMEAGGFNLFAATSHGKTTALQAGASVWGNGADPAQSGGAEAYIQRWNSTANALEAKAELFNDLPLVIDEVGEGDEREFGRTIYRIMSGTGRGRSKRDGTLADSKSWRVLVLSAGELPVSEYIAAGGGKVKGGQLVRLVDVPAESIFSSGEDADAMKELCATHYGHAGREMLKAGDLLRGWDSFNLEDIGPAMTNEAGRVRKRFALAAYAGCLCVELGILPWSKGQVIDACSRNYRAWLNSSVAVSEAERGIENVQAYLIRYGASRFEDERIFNQHMNERDGWFRDGYFNFSLEAFNHACNGANPQAVKKALHDQKLLRTEKPTGHTYRIRVGSERVTVISVKSSILEDSQENDVVTTDSVGKPYNSTVLAAHTEREIVRSVRAEANDLVSTPAHTDLEHVRTRETHTGYGLTTPPTLTAPENCENQAIVGEAPQ